MWRHPPVGIAFLLVTEAVVLTWAVLASLTATVSLGSLIRFTVLLVCAGGHLLGTRKQEEQRRYTDHDTEHVDQTSIWIFPAALALPVPLTLALVLLVRAHRYRIARKPMNRFVFSTACITASALGVHQVAAMTPLDGWFTGAGRLVLQVQAHAGMSTVGIVAAVAAYFAAQALLVGLARGLSTGNWSLRNMIGDTATNLFILSTLGLAVLAAAVLAFQSALEVVMVFVAVRSTRVEQSLQEARVDNQHLAHDAFHDPKTGLLNRRGFETPAAAQLVVDQAADAPSAVVFIDIDHFKAINDQYGHPSGDTVLAAVADVLSGQTRDGDLVCRWGGEEMIALLPGAGHDVARDIAERIRAAVAGLETSISTPAGNRTVRLGHDGVPACTVSIGVALAPGHGTDLETLAAAADAAMYVAKRRGRNRVEFAPLDHQSASSLTPAPI